MNKKARKVKKSVKQNCPVPGKENKRQTDRIGYSTLEQKESAPGSKLQEQGGLLPQAATKLMVAAGDYQMPNIQSWKRILQKPLADVPLTREELEELFQKYKVDGHYRANASLPPFTVFLSNPHNKYNPRDCFNVGVQYNSAGQEEAVAPGEAGFSQVLCQQVNDQPRSYTSKRLDPCLNSERILKERSSNALEIPNYYQRNSMAVYEGQGHTEPSLGQNPRGDWYPEYSGYQPEPLYTSECNSYDVKWGNQAWPAVTSDFKETFETQAWGSWNTQYPGGTGCFATNQYLMNYPVEQPSPYVDVYSSCGQWNPRDEASSGFSSVGSSVLSFF